MPNDAWQQAFAGSFSGVLRWGQFDALWAALRARPGGWYVRRQEGAPCTEPETEAGFLAMLDDTEAELKRLRPADSCGVVYVDDAAAPGFIKIFHPRKMGTGCSCDGPSLPWLVLSRMAPPVTHAEPPKPGLWQKLLRRQA